MVGGVSGLHTHHVQLPVMAAPKIELESAPAHLQAQAGCHAINNCLQKLYHAILIHVLVKKMYSKTLPKLFHLTTPFYFRFESF
jgi:hypothetical protein